MRRVMTLVATVLIAACSATPPAPSGSAAPSGSPAPTTPLASAAPGAILEPRVAISPAAVLLTEVGASRKLAAQAYDAAGIPSGGSTTWASNDPATVEIASDGTLTARASGSAQITASVNGVSSAPVLVVVATPAAGAILVDDEQIVGGPAITNANAATYEVTLSGLSPKVSDILVGTGGKPLGGRVVAVDGQTATVEPVSPGELVTDLELTEIIDMSRAPIQIPADIARLYDVERTGNTFEFVPKPDFMEQVGRQRLEADDRPMAAVGTMFAVGTYMLPFEECETSLPSLPITLSNPPGFTIEISPTLDIAWTPDDELVHWLVRAEPKATLNLGLAINAQFEAKVECKATFFEFPVPIAGFLSWLLGGVVPVGLGFELGGKVVVATATVGGKVEASAKVAVGVACAIAGCSLDHSLTDTKVDPKWTFSLPSIGNVRLQPSFEVSAFAEAELSPLLRLEVAKAKVGGQFSADWSPRISQMTDPEYRSEYKLTLEAGVSVGNELSGIAEKLGLDEIAAAELKISTDLYHSPTAKLTTDKPGYEGGETVHARVHFDPPDNLKILGLSYNVERVLLVSYTGATATMVGTETILGTQTATDGQDDFAFDFVAEGRLNASDLYAFVVPKFLSPIDELALELERVVGTPHLGFLNDGAAWAMKPDGSGAGALTLSGSSPPAPLAVSSPSGQRFAYVSGGGLWISDASGSSAQMVGPAPARSAELNFLTLAWSPDESRVAYVVGEPASLMTVGIDGTGSVTVPPTHPENIGVAAASWSPDGSLIAVEHFGGIEVVAASGGSSTAITPPLIDCEPNTCVSYFDPTWSPDSSRIAAIGIDPRAGGPGARIVVMNADGSDITPITSDIGYVLRLTPLAWSTDGIVFTAQGSLGSYSIWAVNPDGSNLRQLTSPQSTIPAPYWFIRP